MQPRQAGLSPRVKRLLAEHSLEPSEIEGSGQQGRITPRDVLRAATHRSTGSRLSPRVKRLLREHQLDAAEIHGTGTDGRVTPRDVLRATGERSGRSGQPGGLDGSPRTTRPSQPDDRSADERVQELTSSQRTAMERMLAYEQQTARLTAAVEADVTTIVRACDRVDDAYHRRNGAALAPLALIVRSVCRTLVRHPLLNASVDTQEGVVHLHRSIDLGLKTFRSDHPGIPIIVDAQELTAAGLHARITDAVGHGHRDEASAGDRSSGTFTVADATATGLHFDTPILHEGQVGSLAVTTIEKRPVVITDGDDDQRIAIRYTTQLCLSYDHRLVDGADAARFLTDLAADLGEADWDRELAEFS